MIDWCLTPFSTLLFCFMAVSIYLREPPPFSRITANPGQLSIIESSAHASYRIWTPNQCWQASYTVVWLLKTTHRPLGPWLQMEIKNTNLLLNHSWPSCNSVQLPHMNLTLLFFLYLWKMWVPKIEN